MTATATLEYALKLNDEERKALLGILEQALREVHVEKRRTESPGYQDLVAHEETLIRDLTEKVRALHS